jgi:hypothetical protein
MLKIKELACLALKISEVLSISAKSVGYYDLSEGISILNY